MVSEEEILAAEVERKARWDRLEAYLSGAMANGTPAILDLRSVALLLEHVAGLEAIVVRLSSDAADQAQESKAALEEAVAAAETDQRTIDRLLLDLNECRAELGDAQANLVQAILETTKAQAERDAALARLSEPRPEQSGGVVVVELGVRLGVMAR